MESQTRIRLSKRQIAAVVAGNGLDFYDFLTYAFFATQIADTLFPKAGGHQLLLTLATFGIGFLTRPLGSIVIGRIADKRGRRPAMLLSFLLMGAALIGLALTPPYAVIGMAAPVLAVAFRMLQGFALGGEVGPNTAYLLEAAPLHRRGVYTSLQFVTQNAAILASGTVGLILSSLLSPAELTAWGWRVAFLLGAVIVPFALAVRRSLDETLHHADPDPVEPMAQSKIARLMAIGVLAMAGGTVTGYTLDYLNTFAQKDLGMAANAAFGSTAMLGLSAILVDFAAGWLSDRYGRKAVLIPANVLLILLLPPAFMLVAHFRSTAALLAITAILSMTLEFATNPAVTLLAEALPRGVRASGLGTIYALSLALFGGSTQVVDQLLIDLAHSPLAPGWYAAGALLIAFSALLLLPERYRAAGRGRERPPKAAAPA
ncbi:MFS transporter [Sphingomonas sp. GlSt437]|uniref:MFS transporter n=1 Tax=Sphingomonas sp. GlSt437 TaxID=3389970 RepID=UPI003A8492AB